ncbi:MAG: AtpZ/AtpI family protein [Kiritimatiellae bacterium]|nr:AtpZ/AtpI family protein [Kiritimatiellia bacterium]
MASQTVWQGLATLGSLGFTLVGCTFLGLFAGYYLDRWLNTRPWLTILLLLFGIAAGFLNIFVSASRAHTPRRSAKDTLKFDVDRNQ